MASPIASKTLQGSPAGPLTPVYIPKLTAIDKVGGIYCHQCDAVFGNKKEFDAHYSTHITGGGDIVYTCVVCKKQITSYPSFRGHCYLGHVVKDKFQCQHCLKCFSKLSVLSGHIRAMHEFKCAVCDTKFSTKQELECHKYIHKNKANIEPPYDCLDCGDPLNTLDICEGHIDDHCEILYPCPICNEAIDSKIDTIKHLTKHYDETFQENIAVTSNNCEDSSIDVLGGILCCHCDILFKNRRELDNHFTLDHEDKIIVYTCHICGKQYEKYNLFGNHCSFHFTKDKFQCEQCVRTFPRLSLLVTHTDMFHCDGALDKPYRCETCGHAFKARYRLYEHMKVAHNEICIKCPLPDCNTGFESPKDLSVHMKKHKARLERCCRSCGLQLSSLASAAKHLDVHHRKRYSCPVCSRSYAEKYLLMKHVPQHFAATTHACHVCGRKYLARNRLIQHLKTHSDTRPHKCPFCSKSFVHSNELKQHLNLHSSQRPFECIACSKTFNFYSNWRKHLIHIHKFDKSRLRTIRKRDRKLAEPVKEDESGSETEGSVEMLLVEDSNMMQSDQLRKLLPVPEPVNTMIERYIGPENELKSEYFTAPKADDLNEIKAIVEHIDAMSGELESSPATGAAVAPDVPQFTEIPVANANITLFNPEEPSLLTSLPPAYPLEYGPDFSIPDPDSCSTGFIDLDDHNLPHINPLLTIKEVQPLSYSPGDYSYDEPSFLYQQQNLEPLITKICSYDECSDSNRMFIVNSNIF